MVASLLRKTDEYLILQINCSFGWIKKKKDQDHYLINVYGKATNPTAMSNSLNDNKY